MSGLPTFDDVREGVQSASDSVQEHGRNLIPWLPDPPNCERCGAMMYATVTFDSRMVQYTNAWECRADGCNGPMRYRDDPNVPDPDPPQRGATQLREVLK